MHVQEKGRKIKINIVNCRKGNNLFNRGHRPFIKNKKADNDWTQGGENIEYKPTKLKYFPISFLSRKKYFTLLFEYETEYDNDEIQFAYCIPYEYTRMMKMVNSFENNKNV